MDMDFLAGFASNNPEEEFAYSKGDILKVLKRIGVDTRFVSYFEDEDGSIKLYIENLRFSKFSRNRTAVFNRHYLFQDAGGMSPSKGQAFNSSY